VTAILAGPAGTMNRCAGGCRHKFPSCRPSADRRPARARAPQNSRGPQKPPGGDGFVPDNAEEDPAQPGPGPGRPAAAGAPRPPGSSRTAGRSRRAGRVTAAHLITGRPAPKALDTARTTHLAGTRPPTPTN
jgi:hypothetical protein